MVDLTLLLDANRILRDELQRRLSLIDDREGKARSVLKDCEAERRELGEELAAIDAAERIYRRRFVPADPPALEPTLPTFGEPPYRMQQRARIGRQRYRILAFLRKQNQLLSPEEIALNTTLLTKRVRDQLRSDIRDGVVTEADGRYAITQNGLHLLDRFESYKRGRGEPLPSLSGPLEEGCGEEDESEQPMEAEAVT